MRDCISLFHSAAYCGRSGGDGRRDGYHVAQRRGHRASGSAESAQEEDVLLCVGVECRCVLEKGC
jgi:hypothetical protein